MLQSVAILFHPRRKQAIAEAEWLAGYLGERGVRVALGSGWDENVIAHLCCDRQLVVVLGGDGTIIRVARLASPYGVPLLGVNLGRVGFLAELTPEALHDRAGDILAAAFWVEERTMLDVRCLIGGEARNFICLNEVALARGLAPRAIHVHTLLDGHEFMTYTADGILVATATGSTAYSLAAGGPVLYPESRDYMITPVAPHLHIGRSMILPGDTTARLCLASNRPAVLSIDGADEHDVGPDDTVDVRRSQEVARFARLDERQYFYAALAARLH